MHLFNLYTEFHERVIEGDNAWVKNYLERGGDTNFQSADGVPPLYLAIVNGHFETVKVLVEQGADINLTTPKYYADLSPVFVAAWKKQDEIMQFLLEQGAITNIYFSALVGDLEALKKYVNEGGDVNARRSEGQAQYYSLADTLLHVATWRDSVEAVEFLLEQGADIEARDGQEATPLHDTAWRRPKTTQLLIQKGADVQVKDCVRNTPLHNAVAAESEEIIQLLLDSDANINALAYGGNTPLHQAVACKSVKSVKTLLNNGADTNIKTNFDLTPLDEAKQLKGEEKTLIIELLQQHSQS